MTNNRKTRKTRPSLENGALLADVFGYIEDPNKNKPLRSWHVTFYHHGAVIVRARCERIAKDKAVIRMREIFNGPDAPDFSAEDIAAVEVL